MSPIPIPPQDEERVAALHALKILDTPQDERFERLVRLARLALQVPIALISLIDHDRQWFKACQGIQISETSREISFCTYAILQSEAFIISDTLEDERFANNPQVTGAPFIRAYMGYPLRESRGYHIGTICVIDFIPRQFEQHHIQALRDLAFLIEREINEHLLHKIQSHQDQCNGKSTKQAFLVE